MSEASAPASKTIGDQLVAYCRDGKNLECINTLYADDVVSIEAAEGGAGPRVTKGKEGVIGKNTWWQENMEVRRASVDGPFPHGDDRFAVIFDFDVKNKQTGDEMTMKEVGVFHLGGGKVVREEFFYAMG
ncbi:MAG: nuclear transport factor 2 family protein [Myxococcota bacterium]